MLRVIYKGLQASGSVLGKSTFLSLFWTAHISYFFFHIPILPTLASETIALQLPAKFSETEVTFFPYSLIWCLEGSKSVTGAPQKKVSSISKAPSNFKEQPEYSPIPILFSVKKIQRASIKGLRICFPFP